MSITDNTKMRRQIRDEKAIRVNWLTSVVTPSVNAIRAIPSREIERVFFENEVVGGLRGNECGHSAMQELQAFSAADRRQHFGGATRA